VLCMPDSMSAPPARTAHRPTTGSPQYPRRSPEPSHVASGRRTASPPR
jgi:hypothetical protein